MHPEFRFQPGRRAARRQSGPLAAAARRVLEHRPAGHLVRRAVQLSSFATESRVVDDAIVTFEVAVSGYWHFPGGARAFDDHEDRQIEHQATDDVRPFPACQRSSLARASLRVGSSATS